MPSLFTRYCPLFLVIVSAALTAAPLRVITTSPSLTELLYQIGAEQKLIATVDYSFYPEAAKKLPTIGNFFSPSIEKTLLYNPDLVLIDGAARNYHYEQALKRLGITFEVLTIESVQNLLDASNHLQQILEVRKPLPSLPQSIAKQPYSFIGFVWSNPSIVLTKKTFLNSLMEAAGGKNLADFKEGQSYVTVSREWLLLSKPDILFFLCEMDSQKPDFTQFVNSVWGDKTPKIVFLPSLKFARTTFTALEALENISKEIHAAQ